MLSCNVSSLEAHWADIVDTPWDCLLVQEARITPDSWVWKDCQRRGWAGHPGPLGPNGQSLVAAVTKSGSIHMRGPLAAGPPERSMNFLWHAGGPCPWTITNCYAPADGSQAARLMASAMIREAAAEAEAHWARPCLVAGDFQWSLQELPIAHALGVSNWADIGDPQPTCDQAATPRRIDLLLANPAMQARLQKHTLQWDLGIRTHAAQSIVLSAGKMPLQPTWQQAEAFPPPSPGGLSAHKAMRRIYGIRQEFLRYVDLEDLDGAWTHLCTAICSYHQYRAGANATGMRRPSKRVWSEPEPVAALDEPDIEITSRVHLKRLRRIEALLATWGHGPNMSGRSVLICNALTRAEGAGSPWIQDFNAKAHRPHWESVKEQAHCTAQASAKEAKVVRRDRWHYWCTEQMSTGGSRVYKWVRDGPKQVRAPLACDWKAGDPGEPPGKCNELAALHNFWQGLWAPTHYTPPAMAEWLSPLSNLKVFPTLPEVEAGALKTIVKHTSTRKAAGADGMTYAEMRDWPMQLFEDLSTFLKLVEHIGHWPSNSSPNVVCLLPKGGTAAPDDRRPIVLLSCIYRLWAAHRAKIFRQWLRSNNILPEGEACGPEVKAGELALHMAGARLLGGAMGGLALDWSKCYDRLPLSVLQDLAIAAGLPRGIWSPMLQAYALPRLVRADGVAGPTKRPTCGLAPGCPGATDWLALLVHLWKTKIEAIDPIVWPNGFHRCATSRSSLLYQR